MKLFKLMLGLTVLLGSLYSLFIGELQAPDYVIFSVLAIAFLVFSFDTFKEKRIYGSLLFVNAMIMAMIAIKDLMNLIG